MKKHIFEISLLISFCLTIALSLISFEKDCVSIRENVFRLHVVANSNSKEDQELKLYVRDRILSEFQKLKADCQTKNQAEKTAEENLSLLKKTAEKAIKEKGYSYNVDVLIENCFFPTKTYDNFTLPAGSYDALRILIGSAEGKNWWCVMFPSLCIPAAQKETTFSDILSEDELKIINSKPKYEIRFWFVEKFQLMKEKLKNKTKS
ncbi:MAG: stage II sporulation protein R [Clostridia bacterium]|nr:stage II sporulation protein R [Clostridia bacterium]